VAEINRLQQACIDLEGNKLSAFGGKMFETHDGLSKEYEVSCIELDFLVDQVRNTEGVAGARMMGGGFGGCTINLIKSNQVDAIVQRVSQAYTDAFHLEMKPYVVSVEEGSTVLK
jgi:galactokinase